jgi:hypothetical protein
VPHAYYPKLLATWEVEIRRIMVQSQPRQIVHEILSQKYSTQKRTGEAAQVIEPLPSKQGPKFKPHTTKKKKKKTWNCSFSNERQSCSYKDESPQTNDVGHL